MSFKVATKNLYMLKLIQYLWLGPGTQKGHSWRRTSILKILSSVLVDNNIPALFIHLLNIPWLCEVLTLGETGEKGMRKFSILSLQLF